MAKRHGRRRAHASDASQHAARSHAVAPSIGPAKRFVRRFDIPWLMLACIVPAALCFIRLGDDLWYDEIYTLSYAEQSFAAIATDYSAPNNHVLFAMLLRPFYTISLQDISLRLPSLACSMVSLVCVFYIGRTSGGVALGSASVVALGLNQMFLGHTMQVRGYSLSMCLAAALGLLVVQGGARSWGRSLAMVVAAVALVYTIPSNAIFAACVAIAAIGARWYVSRSWHAVVVELVTWAVAALIAALLYAPIFEQVLAARSDEVTGTWASTLRLAGRFYWAALHDFVFLIPIAGIGLTALIRHGWSSGKIVSKNGDGAEETTSFRVLVWIVSVMFVVPFLVTAILGISSFVRVYSPLLPFVAVTMAWLVVEGTRALLTWWAQWRNRPAPRSVMLSAISMLLLAVATIPWLATYPLRLAEVCQQRFAQDGYYNYYAANYHPSQVAAYLRRTVPRNQPYLVCFDDADMVNLRWYMTQLGVERGRLRESPSRETLARVFLVLPPLPRYDQLAAQTGLTTETLKSLPATADFGYYRVFASRGMLTLNQPAIEKPSDE